MLPQRLDLADFVLTEAAASTRKPADIDLDPLWLGFFTLRGPVSYSENIIKYACLIVKYKIAGHSYGCKVLIVCKLDWPGTAGHDLSNGSVLRLNSLVFAARALIFCVSQVAVHSSSCAH